MALIKFENNKDEGFYLLATSGKVGFFPNSVFGVTDRLLRELEPVFREKGIRYHRLSQAEADELAKNGKRKKPPTQEHYAATWCCTLFTALPSRSPAPAAETPRTRPSS